MNSYFLFILASRHHKHLTVGVCADLPFGVAAERAAISHRLKKRRVLQKLVYVEKMHCLDDAITRKLELDRKGRAELCALVDSVNPAWEGISLRTLSDAGY